MKQCTLLRIALAGWVLGLAWSSRAEVSIRELMAGPPAQERVYKTVAGEALKLFYFTPTNSPAISNRPAVIWIHGGAWVGGTTDGFMPHARYCAARGAVGFNITYRLAKPAGASVADCLADCNSAVRCVRAHATEFGVNPNRIVVAGDSAGGHLAAALGTLTDFDDPGDNLSMRSAPDAMVLLNPIVDMTEGEWVRYAVGGAMLADKKSPLNLSAENLARACSLSPIFHVRPGQPPALLMHGLADKIVAHEQARRFAAAMTREGNRCDLVLLDGQPHAFGIAYYKSAEPVVVQMLRRVDEFLTSLGFWSGPPTLIVSKEPAWLPRSATNSPPANTVAK